MGKFGEFVILLQQLKRNSACGNQTGPRFVPELARQIPGGETVAQAFFILTFSVACEAIHRSKLFHSV